MLGSPVRNLVSILVFMAVVVTAGTLAYMHAGWSFADASYMVALTVYTVGYGEVHPIATPYLHAVTMSLMVLGCTGMILLTSAIVQIFTVMQLRQMLSPNRMQTRIEKLDNHVIVCGFGRIGVMLAQELAAGGLPLVVLERDPARLAQAETAGHLCLAGDATEESALEAAGIARARVLATVLPNDAANVFITLSARKLAPAIEIIARGEAPSTEQKLRHAGADQVVLPTHIGAERIARMVLYPESKAIADADRLERDLGEFGLRFERVTIAARSAAAGHTVQEAERIGLGSFFVAQISRGDQLIARPGPGARIEAGDTLMIVARDPGVAARALVAPRGQGRTGRMRV